RVTVRPEPTLVAAKIAFPLISSADIPDGSGQKPKILLRFRLRDEPADAGFQLQRHSYPLWRRMRVSLFPIPHTRRVLLGTVGANEGCEETNRQRRQLDSQSGPTRTP